MIEVMQGTFAEIGMIMAVAVAVAGIMHALKQPLIIAYIITGLIVGPYFLDLIQSKETFEVFSSIGVALLLFIIGLGLNPRVVKDVGKIALITGVGQVVFTFVIGTILATVLGFEPVTAAFIGAALTFSSTIIVLKLLSDKKELNHLHGKVSIGFLLVQDIIAALLLVILVAVSKGGSISQSLTKMGLIAIVAVVVFLLFTHFVLPVLNKLLASSQEFLFLFALAWGFGIAALMKWVGLSVEIGALFAGVMLASSPYSLEISSKFKPLRDFFLIVFFILLGAKLQPSDLGAILVPGILFSLLVLIGNPIIVMSLMGSMRYSKKTSFKAGLAVAQISEFSLILVVLGQSLGKVESQVVSLVTFVAIVTIAASSYMIMYSDWLLDKLSRPLSIFERSVIKQHRVSNEKWDIVVFGFRSSGQRFLKSVKKSGRKVLVVDYDPVAIDQLTAMDVPYKYGDAGNVDLLDEIGLNTAKLVISTITDPATNMLIVEKAKEPGARTLVVVTSDEIDHAADLYEAGAHYVIMPHYIGAMKTGEIMEREKFDLSDFLKEKEKHLKYMESVRSL